MKGRNGRVRQAFTLVELLTVIFIIALLIGILVPSIAAARNQAKNGKTRGTVSTIEKGCEMYNNEFGEYPASRGKNPFETADIYLSGAQWAALQLCGADLQGYVKPVLQNDSGNASTPGDGKIDRLDWLDWYANQPKRSYPRLGPYVQNDGKVLRSPITLSSSTLITIPDLLAPQATGRSGSSNWGNSRLSFFVDAFDYPIIYYAGNSFAKQPITTRGGVGLTEGTYDQSDNVAFTGGDVATGFTPFTGAGWDLPANGVPAGGVIHPMGKVGYQAGDRRWPAANTFASTILDRNVYDSTRDAAGNGKLVAHKADKFLLVSPGRDGLYGTGDDVRNFGN